MWCWAACAPTITLNPNGGTLPEFSLVEGAALPIPTKTGYTFVGWYENQELTGVPVADIPTNNTENLNFYAKWTANTYTVIFDANGGSVDPTSAVTVAGKLTSLPTPTYDGYNFLGWYTQKDGGDKVTTDTVFTMDSTIYAHWQNIPVTGLELNKNSLTLQEKGSDTLTATVKPADATNQDVTWESSDTDIATVSEDGTVTAVSAGRATITATAADGSGASASCEVTVTHGDMVQTPKKDATCTVDGTEGYWTCGICGKHFKDEGGTVPTTPEESVIPATGHEFEGGLCSVCGARDTSFSPALVSGDGAKWTKGSSKGLTFVSSAAFADLVEVRLDGRVLSASEYAVREGSTVVTLPAKLLEDLKAGDHELLIVSGSGTVRASLTVAEAAKVEEAAKAEKASADELPASGDSSAPALAIAAATAAGAGLVVLSRRRAAR